MTIEDIKAGTIDSCKDTQCQGGILFDYKTNVSTPHICMQVFRYLVRLRHACIPAEYWQLHLDTLHIDEKYRDHVKLFLRNHRNALSGGLGMLFLGSNGIGKTSMMTEIGKHFALVGYRVLYFTLQKYLNSRFQENKKIEIANYDILLIDELDKAYGKTGNDYLMKTFEELVRQVLSLNKVSIMATNASKAGIKEMFGRSVFSALERKIQLLAIKGEDFSGKLQDGWDARLTMEIDFFHENIVRMAERVEHQKQ